MKRIFLLALIQGISITCQANESIQIRDSEDSRLYLAPKHARRSGLSSYILRAPSTSRPASKYFTGSPKPIWDDDSVDKPRKIITLECLGGSACSQSIPLWSDSDEENSVYDNYEEAPKVTFRPILKKQTTSSTTETPLKSLGLSVASIYNPPRGSQWPKITRKPTITRRPTLVHHNRRSQQPPIFQNAETLWPSQPLYHNYERYDPFAFQREKLVQPKRRSTQLTRRRTPEQQFEVPAKVSHYMDSRFDVALQSDGPYRSSLTWKNGKPKSNFQNSRPSYTNNRREYNPEIGISHSYKSERYFPSRFEVQRDEIEVDKPRRNYFPVGDDDDDGHQEDEFVSVPTFVGEEQVVNAGYTVKDSKVTPNEYLISSYEQKPEPDLSQWYDLVEPPSTSRPHYAATTVQPWTSLDAAKPLWEDPSPSLVQTETPKTYGSWSADTLRLGAVPFSRSTDGKERKWVKVASVKRKKVIPKTNNYYIQEDLGLNVQY